MVIRQGDLFWVDLGDPAGSEPAYRHPHVVVQNNIFNQSRINTVVVCALTSNLRRGQARRAGLRRRGGRRHVLGRARAHPAVRRRDRPRETAAKARRRRRRSPRSERSPLLQGVGDSERPGDPWSARHGLPARRRLISGRSGRSSVAVPPSARPFLWAWSARIVRYASLAAAPPVLAVAPCSRNSSRSMADHAVRTAGKCTGSQPAMTAFTATFSAVTARARTGSMPMS